MKLIAKGAEADLWLDHDWNGVKALIKRRVRKMYRHPELDATIRRSRTIHEADIIHRAKEAGVPTPLLYQVDPEGATIVMQYVEGERVREEARNRAIMCWTPLVGNASRVTHSPHACLSIR